MLDLSRRPTTIQIVFQKIARFIWSAIEAVKQLGRPSSAAIDRRGDLNHTAPDARRPTPNAQRSYGEASRNATVVGGREENGAGPDREAGEGQRWRLIWAQPADRLNRSGLCCAVIPAAVVIRCFGLAFDTRNGGGKAQTNTLIA